MEQSAMPKGGDQLILALAAGATVRHIAEQAGSVERTVQRRLVAPIFDGS